MAETDVECVVVGGGIAGLTAAYRLRQHSVLVLEGSDRLGGRVQSQSHGDYWVNLGAMFVAPEGPLAELAHLPGVDLNRLTGKAIMDIKGRKLRANSPFDLMVKAPMSISARSSLARFSLRLGRDFKRMHKHGPDGRAYTDQLDSRSAADVFAVSGDARSIVDALSRSWTSAELDEVSGAHGTAYFYLTMGKGSHVDDLTFPTGGSESVVRAAAAALGPNVRVQTEAIVRSLRSENGIVHVEYELEGRSVSLRAKQAVVATQAFAALEFLGGMPPEYVDALAAVKYGSFLCGGIFTNEAGPQVWDDYSFITTPGRPFGAIFNPVSVMRKGSHRRPGGSLSFYAGGNTARQLMDATDDELIAAWVPEVAEVLGCSTDIFESHVFQRWPRAVPYWSPGSRSSARILRKSPSDTIHLAGDYLGYPGMPTASLAGHHAGNSVFTRLSA
jgi:oxygen-dependent protoporphyrinogen oxidase